MFPRMYPSRWLFWSKQISFQYFKHEKFHVCEFFVIFFKYKYLNWLSFIDIRVSAVQDTNSYGINFVILWRILSQRNKIGCNSIININMKRDKYIFPDVFIALCVKKSQYRETAWNDVILILRSKRGNILKYEIQKIEQISKLSVCYAFFLSFTF